MTHEDLSNMIKLGYSVWKKDVSRIEELTSEFIEQELDHVEIDIDSLLDLDDNTWIMRFKDVFSSYNISIGVHAPWREIHLASPLDDIREASEKIIIKILEILDKLDIDYDYIIIHPSSEQPICSENSIKCIESLKRSVENIRRYTDNIVVESIQGRCCGKLDHIEILIDLVSDTKICLDLAHIYVEYKKLKNYKNLADVLNIVSEKILRKTFLIHLHGVYHENSKDKVHRDFDQTPLGEEDLFLKISGLNNVRYLVFEVFYNRSGRDSKPSDIEREIKRLRELLRHL